MYVPCRFKSCEFWRETIDPTITMDDLLNNKCAVCKRAFKDQYLKKGCTGASSKLTMSSLEAKSMWDQHIKMK